MPKLIDLTGQRFYKLTVLRLAKEKIKKRPAWTCLCDCGKERVVAGDWLHTPGVKHCGEHKMELSSAKRDHLHRMNVTRRKYPKGTDTHSRIYTLWRAMLWRCYDATHVAYSRYGGAGIFVCDAWLDLAGFRLWALDNGYTDTLTIDRINNYLGYTPENCRWATWKEQARNRKSGLVEVLAFGESKPLIDWVSDPRCRVSLALLRKRTLAGIPTEFAMQATESEAKTRAAILRERQKKVDRCMARELLICR